MAKSKVTLSPNDISTKWARNMTANISTITAGIDAVTENPMERAIAKKDKMVANFNRAMSNGRYEAGARNVTLADWKTRTKSKVSERLSGGVQAALPKRQKFDTYLVNTLNGILPTIATMPDQTLDDQINKVRVLCQHMADNSYKGS